MARPRKFEREEALKAAIAVFADRGFEGTSTEDLRQAMGIGRQSLYDTFGDKRQLYLDALQQYGKESLSALIRLLNAAGSPLAGIEAALMSFAENPWRIGENGCLGIVAVCEFGRSDAAITEMTDMIGAGLVSALERRLLDAQVLGEVDADIDPQTAAQFLSSVLSGMKVSARSGASSEMLRGIARLAVRSLT